MKHAILIVACLLLAAGCASLDDRLSAAARTPQAVAQAAADFYVSDRGDESCCVAVVTPGETVFAHAGSADEHALFRIASLSKLFLTPILERLQADGRVDLDRSVASYARLDLPPEYAAVTLRDLVENRSGLPREFLTGWSLGDWCTVASCGCFGTSLYGGFESRTDFARKAWRWRDAVRHPRQVYSSMGYGLVGLALADACGCSLEALLQKELVGPQRLDETTYEPAGAQTNRLTRACAGDLPWFVPRGRDVPENRLGEALRATGGLFSSASDCARVFAAQWPAIEARMKVRPLAAYEQDAVYGLLRVWIQPSGRRILYRAGMIYGGASFVGFDPVSHTIVIILRNVTSWPDAYGFQVMSALE